MANRGAAATNTRGPSRRLLPDAVAAVLVAVQQYNKSRFDCRQVMLR